MLLFNIINESYFLELWDFSTLSLPFFFFFCLQFSQVFYVKCVNLALNKNSVLCTEIFFSSWLVAGALCAVFPPVLPFKSSLSQPDLGWADQSQTQHHTLSMCSNAGCPGNSHQDHQRQPLPGWKNTPPCWAVPLWLTLPAVHCLLLLTWLKSAAAFQGKFLSRVFSMLTF